MTIVKSVKGLNLSKGVYKESELVIRMTGDHIGKSLSIADEDNDIMLCIPLEPIENQLRKILRRTNNAKNNFSNNSKG